MKAAMLMLSMCVVGLMLSGCQNRFIKEPIFPASQYAPNKPEHGLVLTTIGPMRLFPGKVQSWLEECDYTIARKEGEPYVLFPEYLYTNCKQYGPVHQN